jgi:perosamine synthetase
MISLENQIVEAIRAAIGRDAANLHEPSFDDKEKVYVADCIESTFVSSVGPYVTRFEKQLAEYVGVKRAVAVVNGTAALQIALLLAGVKPGDEVLVPALSFIATANAVHYLGATPHFVDSTERTLGIDPHALREYLNQTVVSSPRGLKNRVTGAPIRALVPMHTFGHPCEMHELLEIAEEFGLVLVEDAAESLGSTYRGQHTGSFGKLSAVSFNGNKIITTGGGGAILTNDVGLADEAKHLTTTAKVPHQWEYVHDRIGYNFRMPNINAALGCAQLEKLPMFVDLKRRLAVAYRNEFSDVHGVKYFREPEGCHSNYWLQTLVLDEGNSNLRDAVLKAANISRLACRPAWSLLSSQAPYRDCPRARLVVSEELEKRIINIPSSSFLNSSTPGQVR